MDILANQYGNFLILVVMAKLPADVYLQTAGVTTNDIWEIDELLQVLIAKVKAREISEGVKVYETPLPPHPINTGLLKIQYTIFNGNTRCGEQ